ncbi:MAG: HAD-IA family hydrolase [Acidimicrobiales bacterium]
MINTVFFDFGGVILTSPFDAFDRYERENDLPEGLIRQLNSTNPDDNAWAKFERSDVSVDEFASLFEAEAAALGHVVSGHTIVSLLAGDVRPEMVEAVRRIKQAGLQTACLTNNFVSKSGGGTGIESSSSERSAQVAEVMALFDDVVESSQIGIRKPERGFYEIALERSNVRPEEVAFLDDLGINLKPARALGMTTIKVLGADQALRDLEAVLGLTLR